MLCVVVGGVLRFWFCVRRVDLMNNYKVKVNNEAESREAQELFFELGASWCFGKEINEDLPHNREIVLHNSGTQLFWAHVYEHKNFDDAKEITLPQLKDMVVLKRNNIKDATHTDQDDWKWYIGAKSYVWNTGNAGQLNRWDESHLRLDHVDLKPIEKLMKEYLEKQEDGTYKLVMRGDMCKGDDIEVPENMNFAYKDEFNVHFTKLEMGYRDSVLIWQRHTQPEALPFIDDEPSLNDQYAEIEQVRQSAWQKQEGGSHYKKLAIQPMEYALKNKLDYAQANVVKYVTRHADKNGKEDLLKAIHNIELMIEHYYS